MNANETMQGWGRKVAEDKQWLLHTPTLVVGPAAEFFDGEATIFISEANGEPVPGPVVKLATGHALVANPNAFVELAPREVAFYRLAVEKFSEFMKGAVTHAAQTGIPGQTSVTLLVSLLQAQLRALEAASPTSTEATP